MIALFDCCIRYECFPSRSFRLNLYPSTPRIAHIPHTYDFLPPRDDIVIIYTLLFAANLGHIQEGHHGHSTADPVLAAATAAAMDAAGAPAADESATEAAVAVSAALPEDEEAGEVLDDQEHHQHEEHHAANDGHIVQGGVAGTKTRKNFDERLKELKRFKLKHGHTSVPHKYPANPQLGTW